MIRENELTKGMLCTEEQSVRQFPLPQYQNKNKSSPPWLGFIGFPIPSTPTEVLRGDNSAKV